ncbi:MAG: inorganic phosphate transporter [Candidatus Dormibacteraeota bacterium]|nr:inorganic phosphate transporter [Candidatus Dormibacteraeota bacterium]
MNATLIVVVLVVAAALAFDFTNGFHDTANAMATSIATRALPPRVAVLISAVLNVVGAFLSLSVATTIVKGIVDAHVITVETVLAGLVGAIIWNLITWYFALPSSSSHALIGGLVGAAVVTAGWNAVEYAGVVSKVLLPALISPAVAFLAAMSATFLSYKITQHGEQQVNARVYRYGQVVSASMVSLAHGTNDAQKTMGVITLALITAGYLGQNATVPVWVILACALCIGLGTYIGAWRVIRTLGKGLTQIQSTQGFAAECCSSAVILISSHFGYPLSTTHVASGSVMGAGAGKKLAGVRWSLAGTMVGGWLLTLPAAACLAGAAAAVAIGVGGFAGAAIVTVVLAVVAAGIFLASERTKITAGNVNDEVPPDRVLAIHTAAPAEVPAA